MARGWVFAFTGLLLASGVALAADPPPVPQRGAEGKSSIPSGDLSGAGGLSAKRAAQAAAPSQTAPLTRGGASGSELYKRLARSVVLLQTDAGLGSGSIISKDGQILTAAHVVAGFKEVSVYFKPQREGDKPDAVFIGDVFKVDQTADLAIVKLRRDTPDNIPSIPIGKFESVSVGDEVSAIGHPEGEAWTYTQGIISQIRRGYEANLKGAHAIKADVIQTQTPINPGNSGGPLLNEKGELIGVNSFVNAEAQNMGYAIASDEILAFLKKPVSELPPVEAACKPKMLFDGRTKANDGKMAQMDLKCHGKADMTLIMPDDVSKPEIALMDMDETGKPQGMIMSKTRNGHWDISYWDTKNAGHWDAVGYHPDGKIKPTSYGPYPPKS